MIWARSKLFNKKMIIRFDLSDDLFIDELNTVGYENLFVDLL